MAGHPAPRKSWFSLLLLIAAVFIWLYNESHPLSKAQRKSTETSHREPTPPKAFPVPSESGNSQTPQKSGRYQIFQNCTLTEAKNNDGDSFLVRLPDGKKQEFRLYFVDTPESAFKSYPGGATNHERIRQQAGEMGGITSEQAVSIGNKAKQFTLNLLASRPFALHTEWDSPFHDKRYHAHIEILQNGKPRWLHQVLVEKGLARIKTKPADLPDGTPARREQDHLRELERAAKRAEVGVWGL